MIQYICVGEAVNNILLKARKLHNSILEPIRC